MSTNFDRLREVFQAAVEQHAASQWDAYLDEACAGDTELRQQAALLLKAHAEGGSLVNAPLPDKDRTGLYQPVTERPGAVIGPYKLLQQIGEGGMGTVFMAEQTKPVQRKVALKVIKAGMDSRQVIARFEAERQALAVMDHVNIARVFDGGATANGRPYFVMELVHGVPITKYCDDNHLTPRQRLELFVPVCQAIQHAHQKGIIHRDIKPSNVMVTLYDGKPVPKVIDFGVAKATEQKLTERTLFTQYGAMVGTLEYMSPEQAEMSALGVDTRSDIYSLGVLLYELLTGSTPLTHKRMKEAAYAEILRMIKEEEPPRPSTRLSDSGEALASISAQRHMEPAKLTKLVRGELDWIVMKCLEKDRNRRYETANGFAADVQRYLNDEAVQACPPTALYRFRKFARRNKGAMRVAVGILSLLTLLTAGIGWAVRDRVARQAEVSRQAEDSLVAARALIAENQTTLARQKLAEARGHIGNNRAALRGLLEDIEALEAELVRFDAFFASIDQAHQAELSEAIELASPGSTVSAGADLASQHAGSYERDLHKAVSILLDAMSRFGILDHDDWCSRLERGVLGRDQVRRIQRAAYEELLWLADDVVRRQADHQSGQKISTESAARQALVYLQKAEPAHRLTTAFYTIRARCRKALRQEDAARRDLELVRTTPGTIALDHYLLGQEAYDAGNKAEAIKQFEAALRLEPTHYWSMMRLGWCLSYSGPHPDSAEAVRVYSGCIMKRPADALAYHHRGIAYHNSGRYEDAVADFSTSIELDPTRANAWFNRGESHGQLGQWDKALADFSEAIALNPKYAPAWSDRGKVHRELGQFDKALADCSTAIELDPKLKQAWTNRAYVCLGLGQADKALADCSRAIEIDPKFAAAWNNRGCAYDKLGRLDKAIAEFSKAIELDPNYAMAWENRGEAYGRLDQLDKCLADSTKAIELDPRLAGAWNNRGIAHSRLGQLDKAIADYSKAIELDPNFAAAWSNRGCAYDKLGRLDSAIAEYSKAIELDPKYAMAWINRGDAYRCLGQLAKAIANSTKAIELDPKLALGRLSRGATYTKLGQFDKAIADYSRGLELAPNNTDANNDLAWLFATCPNPTLRDPGRAVELAKKAVGLAPKQGGHWNTLGVAHYRAGNWKAAIAALEKSMELRKGGDSIDWFFLGMAHWQMDRKEEARKWYDQAVEWMEKNDPKNEELGRFRAEAEQVLKVTK